MPVTHNLELSYMPDKIILLKCKFYVSQRDHNLLEVRNHILQNHRIRKVIVCKIILFFFKKLNSLQKKHYLESKLF